DLLKCVQLRTEVYGIARLSCRDSERVIVISDERDDELFITALFVCQREFKGALCVGCRGVAAGKEHDGCKGEGFARFGIADHPGKRYLSPREQGSCQTNNDWNKQLL